MIRVENRLGRVEIAHEYFAEVVAHAAAGCFGVSGMIPVGYNQGLRQVTGVSNPNKGVRVYKEDDALAIELHIEVVYGLNIAAISRSIVMEVRYALEQSTGLRIGRITVCVDAMKTE